MITDRLPEQQQQLLLVQFLCLNLLLKTGFDKIPVSKKMLDGVSPTEMVDLDLIPGWLKPKTIKLGIHSFHA